MLEAGEKQSCLADFHCEICKNFMEEICVLRWLKKLSHFSYIAQMKQMVVISVCIFSSLEIVNSSLVFFSPSWFCRVSSFWTVSFLTQEAFPKELYFTKSNEIPEFRKGFSMPTSSAKNWERPLGPWVIQGYLS